MSLSPFDHPFLSGLFEDAEFAALLSLEADIAAMVQFEIALAGAGAEFGLIPKEAAQAIARLASGWSPDIAALKAGVEKDGVVVPELVRQMRAALDVEHRIHLHFGATSQDVIDTGLTLRLKSIVDLFSRRVSGIEGRIKDLDVAFGANVLMGRTRMQDALEITVHDRLTDWSLPLVRDHQRLDELSPRLLVLQLGGAVGTREKFDGKGGNAADVVARALGLKCPEKAWHNQRDAIVEFASWLALLSGGLGKIGQDLALMAQAHDGSVTLDGGGASSAMPHKSNPVAAEVLVSLARYNAGASGTIAQALVHEQERSGAAWTLEWLILPQMIMAAGRATLLADRLLGSITGLGRKS